MNKLILNNQSYPLDKHGYLANIELWEPAVAIRKLKHRIIAILFLINGICNGLTFLSVLFIRNTKPLLRYVYW